MTGEPSAAERMIGEELTQTVTSTTKSMPPTGPSTADTKLVSHSVTPEVRSATLKLVLRS